jgi:hypothetical protein
MNCDSHACMRRGAYVAGVFDQDFELLALRLSALSGARSVFWTITCIVCRGLLIVPVA